MNRRFQLLLRVLVLALTGGAAAGYLSPTPAMAGGHGCLTCNSAATNIEKCVCHYLGGPTTKIRFDCVWMEGAQDYIPTNITPLGPGCSCNCVD